VDAKPTHELLTSVLDESLRSAFKDIVVEYLDAMHHAEAMQTRLLIGTSTAPLQVRHDYEKIDWPVGNGEHAPSPGSSEGERVSAEKHSACSAGSLNITMLNCYSKLHGPRHYKPCHSSTQKSSHQVTSSILKLHIKCMFPNTTNLMKWAQLTFNQVHSVSRQQTGGWFCVM